MLSQEIYVIIYPGVSAPGYDIDVVDGINATVKRFIFQIMSTVNFPGAKMYGTEMTMHSEMSTGDVGLSQ